MVQQIKTSLLVLMLLLTFAPGINAQEPTGGIVQYLPVFASMAVGVLGGYGSAVLDAQATDTRMATSVWTLTFFGEGGLRAFVVNNLFKLSGSTGEGAGHIASRIASYGTYFFTHNKLVTYERRMKAIRCVEIFFESFAYGLLIAAADQIPKTSG